MHRNKNSLNDSRKAAVESLLSINHLSPPGLSQIPSALTPIPIITRAVSAPDFSNGTAHELYPPPITPPFSGVPYEMNTMEPIFINQPLISYHLPTHPPSKIPSTQKNRKSQTKQKLLKKKKQSTKTKKVNIINIPSKVPSITKDSSDIINETHLFNDELFSSAFDIGHMPPLTYSKTTPMLETYEMFDIGHYPYSHQPYAYPPPYPTLYHPPPYYNELPVTSPAGLASIPDFDPSEMPPFSFNADDRRPPPISRSFQYRNYHLPNDMSYNPPSYPYIYTYDALPYYYYGYPSIDTPAVGNDEQLANIAESFHELDLISRVQAMKDEQKRLEQKLNSLKKKNISKQMQNKSMIAAANAMQVQFKREKKALLNILEKQKNSSNNDFWITQIKKLKKEKKIVMNKNMTAEITADVVNNCIQKQIEKSHKKLIKMQKYRKNQREINMQLELKVMDLSEIVGRLKEKLHQQKNQHFSYQMNKKNENNHKNDEKEKMEEKENEKMEEKENEKIEEMKKETNTKIEIKEEDIINNEDFPCDLIILQNLIRAQAEFYFSDYNLKRDKRLLEKILKEPMVGYLSTDTVLTLARIRQLCNNAKQLYDALKHSPYISIVIDPKSKTTAAANIKENTAAITSFESLSQQILDDISYEGYVGRKDFIPPAEKEFPFRRTIFIYGLALDANEKHIHRMCNPFGGVTKVQFDYGPDSMDRDIMRRMLVKPRVHKLLSRDSAAVTLTFSDVFHEQNDNYSCRWCKKEKACVDGYYHPMRKSGSGPPQYMICLQCSAARAEEQAVKYDGRSKLVQDDKRLKELLMGLMPRSISCTKTALCVFSSQRQASKCVYVRSRLSFDGAFATHYHHYSKLKKEIAGGLRGQSAVVESEIGKQIG